MDSASLKTIKYSKIAITLLILVVATTIFSSATHAQTDERVIVNSANWIDVYSGVLYANLQGKANYFLTSPRHATLIPFSIPKSVDKLEVITSRSEPFAAGYKTLLEVDGYDDVEELRTANANIELGERLTTIDKFIILDDSYGYNAISVAPYAALGEYWVLFADRRSISQVEGFLDDRDVEELIIYGQVDREVKEALERFNPDIINTGDRFDNNIEIVKRYQKIHKEKFGSERKQAILNNGEFIEASLMSGADPVLFIGFSNVPEQVREYVADSELEVGTLVGNELIGSATFIRRQTGLSVFVKFGQGSRTPTNTITQVEDLDRFPIPRYGLNLALVAASLNTATNNLEVTYQNSAEVGTYFQTLSLTVTDDNGLQTIPDDGTVNFIDANSFKTIIYPLKDADDNTINLEGDEITAAITTIYGESPKSLEQTLIGNASVIRITVLDEANIEIEDAAVEKGSGDILVTIVNTGEVEAYVSLEALDVYVNGETIIYSSEGVSRIGKGGKKVIRIPTDMQEEDFPENPEIKIRAYYGERENALTKQKQATFEFKFAAADPTLYIAGALILILILLIIFRKKCKHCGHRNMPGKKYCQKCKNKL